MSLRLPDFESFVAIYLRHGPAENRVICRKKCRDKPAQGNRQVVRVLSRQAVTLASHRERSPLAALESRVRTFAGWQVAVLRVNASTVCGHIRW